MSKILHVLSVVVGFIGIVTFLTSVFGGRDNSVFGVSTFHALFCTAILFLIAIWAQQGAMHHMMLEEKGRMI